MDLAAPDRDRLARTFAAALPDWEDRAAVSSAAGLKDVQLTGESFTVWVHLVDEALEQDRLVQLGRAAAHRKPDDARLAALAEGLAEGKMPSRPTPLAWALAGLALVVFGATAWFVLPQSDSADVPEERTSAEVVAPEPAEPAPETEPTPEVEEQAVAAPEPEPVAEPERETVAQPEPEPEPKAEPEPMAAPEPEPVAEPATEPDPPARVSTPEPAAPTPAATSNGFGPCTDLTGFAYIGMSDQIDDGAITSKGSWTTTQPVNVRADYPNKSNDWDPRQPRVCVLPTGASVELTQPLVLADGGAWWIAVDGAHVTLP